MNDYNLDQYNFEKIGMELKRLRTEHSYTQEQIAGDLGCTVSFVSNIENISGAKQNRVLVLAAFAAFPALEAELAVQVHQLPFDFFCAALCR